MKSTPLRLFAAALFGIVLVLTFAPAPQALAAPTGLTMNVNDTTGLPDVSSGDNKCLAANGKCTLRAAVQQANASSGMDVINLAPNALYKLTRVGSDNTALNGDLDIIEAIDLNGNGATVDANGGVTHDRTFEILEPAVETYTYLENLTLTGGDTLGRGGGILNYGPLALEHVNVSDNHADQYGGGIMNYGVLLMFKSTVESNSCDCTDDSAPAGGGITNSNVFAMSESTVNYNSALTDGGGVWSDGSELQISLSTFYGNRAARNGGGIYAKGASASILSSTIANNVADSNKDDTGGGGGIYRQAGTVTLGHTLLADNINAEDFLFFFDDCVGTLASFGYNLLGTNANCTIPATNNILNVSPGLGTFGDNGGPTQTVKLDSDSPALDAGNPDNCEISQFLQSPYDQREYERIIDGDNDSNPVCDIGAFEADSVPTTLLCNGKPATPSQSLPGSGQKLRSETQVMMGFSSNCATTYKVSIRQNSSNGKRADKVKGLTIGFYLTKILEPGHKYFWRVKACNQFGCAKSGWIWFKLKKP